MSAPTDDEVNELVSVLKRQFRRTPSADRRNFDENHISRLTKLIDEGGTAIIVGPPGVGKSSLVQHCVNHHQLGTLYVLTLRSSLIQNSSRAVNSLLRQYAEQAHEAELLNTTFDDDELVTETHASHRNVEFTAALERLQQVLKETQHRVCIVIEGLEVWGTGKSRDQSLAYALAELPMTHPGHVSVLALTARLDVAEAALDKRVRSRMAQGVVMLEWPEERTLLQDVLSVLQVPVRECEGVMHEYCTAFNARVTALHDELRAVCARMADWSKDRRRYLDLLELAVTRLSAAHPYLTGEDIKYAYRILSTDPQVEVMKGLSVLELSLLVTMHKLEERDIREYNFQLIYKEYKDFIRSDSSFAFFHYEKSVCFKAFERLIDLELVRRTHHSRTGVPKPFQAVKAAVFPSQIRRAVGEHSYAPTALQQWALKWTA